ncbi:MAG: DUF4363 family protein [Nanoarchaeota archaeon]
MRILIIVSLLLLFILGGALAGYYTINSTTDHMVKNLEQLYKETEQNNWKKARQTHRQIIKDWDRANTIYSYFVDHGQLHDLDITLHKTSELLKFEEKKQVIPEIGVALDLIQNIKEEEKLLLENIL